MKNTSRTVRFAIATATTALVAAGCASSGDSSSGGVRSVTAVGGTPSMSYTVPQLIDTKKMAKQHDLELTYQGAGASSTNMVAAVLSGDADFAFPATVTALDAIQEGADLVVVGGGLKMASTLALTTDAVKKSGVSADAPVKQRLAALKGLKVATSPDGSGNNSFLRELVRKAGLDPEKDLKIIGVQDPSAIVGGLKQGRFDAGFYGVGVIEANIAAGDAELWVSSARGDVTELVGDQMGMVMVTSKKTLADRPKVVSAMFDAMVDTEQFIANEPEAAGDALQKAWFPDLDQKVFDLSWEQASEAYPSDGAFTKAQFETAIDVMKGSGKDYTIDYGDAVYAKAQG